MTVCIAGACMHEGEHAIVMCCDWQGTYGQFVKADHMIKSHQVGRFSIMFADDRTHSHQLITAITPHLRGYEEVPKTPGDMDIRVGGLIEAIKLAAAAKMRANVEHYIQLTYGVTGKEFREGSRQWMSERRHDEAWERITGVSLGCELLICYADDEEPLMLTLHGDGAVSWSDPHACIGSGTDIALVCLSQIFYSASMPLMDCLQRIYTAKEMSQKGLYVGESSNFDILIHRRPERKLTEKGWQKLQEFGIQHVLKPEEIEFEKDFIGTQRKPPSEEGGQ